MRPGPHHIGTTGALDGQALIYDPLLNEYRPQTLPGVASVVPGSNIRVDNTDPTHPVVSAIVLEPLTTEVGGVPDFVWDDDNQLVMTEAI